jgi:hypothetical protein
MRSTPRKRQQVDQRLSVRWHEGVEVDDLADQLGDTIRNTSGDHAAVAMADEDEVAQLLALDDAEHVRMCTSRSIAGLARCSRSPSPVYVGVTSSCPAERMSGCIFLHAHPADHAPCATRKVVLAEV